MTARPSFQQSSNVRVKVSLSKQRTYVMEGSEVLLAMPVSVGGPGTSTPTGSFTIFNKEHKHRANTHGYAYSGNQVKQTFLAKRPPVGRSKARRCPTGASSSQTTDSTPAGSNTPLHPRLHPHA